MISFTDLLKEGYKSLEGVNEATIQNIDAARQLMTLTRTSFGPNGMNKMVINHLEKLFVTSDAAAILKEIDIAHPAAKLVVLASQMQEQEIGDGTNLVIILAGELLSLSEDLIRKGLHPSEIIAGYIKAGQEALKFLEELVVWKVEEKDVKNPEIVSKALKSALASKQYGYENLLSPLIAKACIEVCPKNPKNFNVDNVRVAKILGGGVLDTRVVRGFVVPRGVEGTITRVNKATIVIYATGLDIQKTDTKDTVLLTNAEELMNYNKGEEKAMEANIKAMADAGVNVVVSGNAIGEMALHFLERYKIMAIKIPSKFDLRRVAKTVGATPLVKLQAPKPEELGHCDNVFTDEIGSTKVVIFRQDTEESEVSTIVVRAATQNTLDDIERSIDDCVNVFKALAKDGRFVPGAAATEIELAKRLQTFGDATPGLVQYAIKKFAEAFEVVPRALAENAGLVPTDVLASLYAAHQKGNAADGVDIDEGKLLNATEKGIFDLLATKQSAIRLATHAAITVLRVDQIIMAKPAGGPKVPQMGARDDD
jgi:T-complex protein 1 subunit theta